MCGIAGIVNLDGQPVDRRDLEGMTASLIHRGPDGMGVWVNGSTGFGHTRLAIRDLGDGGRQPIQDASGQITVVFNGEIYNDRALGAELSRETGATFHTTCDAEVIAPGWAAWGPRLFDRLEGMFAIAIWDARHRRLVLARDPVGIKPLFVQQTLTSIRFASELKGLLALPKQDVRLSAASLHQYLAEGFAGPARTLLEGIEQIPPGSMLVADGTGTRIHRYWTPARVGDITNLDDAVASFADLWKTVVASMLVSDVPLGLLLSGGIDSSLIAMELRDTGKYAFTGKFPLAEWDESGKAAALASQTGLIHRSANIDLTEAVESTFRRVVSHVDGQLADSSCLPFYKVCEEARRVVPVLLSGDGADEFFGGYTTYRASQLAEIARPLVPAMLGRPLVSALKQAAARSRAPVSTAEQLYRLLAGLLVSRPGQAHVQWRRYLMADEQPALYGPGLRDLIHNDPFVDYASSLASSEGSLLDRCLLADENHYLPGDMLMKVDSMSMAHGLEIRVPFLDRRIIQFAGRLSPGLLAPLRGPEKRVLRRALIRTGADPQIAKRRKRGFNMPVAVALRAGLRPLGDRLLDRDADCLAPWLNPDGVRRMWQHHQQHNADHGYVLWTLLTLAEWKTSVS
jgi:asparagine synthase (glutamine-hydrolysing)